MKTSLQHGTARAVVGIAQNMFVNLGTFDTPVCNCHRLSSGHAPWCLQRHAGYETIEASDLA
jgi:hypothetical protein